MEHAAFMPNEAMGTEDGPEQRGARRYALLIRPAKLICSQGEFVCVLRDVSASGVSVKLFHRLPEDESFTLELQSGQSYEVRPVRHGDGEAGFEFAESVDVSKLIGEIGTFPKRGLRLSLSFPATVIFGETRRTALIDNISQQGAKFECSELLAIDQSLRLEGPNLRETRAKVRWRRDSLYGVVFDDTFSLADFADLAARLQAPSLLG